MTTSDSPANFARIDFTDRECDAMREIREFFRGLQEATIHRAGGNGDVKTIRRELWMICNNVGKNPKNGTFTPVDLTREQCDTLYDAALFVHELLIAEFQRGERNLRAQMFADALVGLKAKSTAAAQLLSRPKPPAIFVG
jgi:hypothetical protein